METNGRSCPAKCTIFLIISRYSGFVYKRHRGPSLRLFKRKVASGHEIDIEIGHSVDLGSFILKIEGEVGMRKYGDPT